MQAVALIHLTVAHIYLFVSLISCIYCQYFNSRHIICYQTMANLLVTGGAGFIGSHCIVELLQDPNVARIVVVDNMSNSKMGPNKRPVSLERVEKLTNQQIIFHKVDLLDLAALRKIFSLEGPFDCVLHFAALKSVSESCKNPLSYYQNNVVGTLNLLELMTEFKCSRLVFSSSSTVYGNAKVFPVTESHPTGNCTNPYGRTKFMMEEIMRDFCVKNTNFSVACLRYFNPLGAHPSGEIGEDATMPQNLMPWIIKAVTGEVAKLPIFGCDWPTRDGTGVRDFTHIMDIARGHVLAVHKILNTPDLGWTAYNFGQGQGNSVLQVVDAFERASGLEVPYEFVERRAGDVARSTADHSKAERELGWRARKTLEEMCADSWRWYQKNPKGY